MARSILSVQTRKTLESALGSPAAAREISDVLTDLAEALCRVGKPSEPKATEPVAAVAPAPETPPTDPIPTAPEGEVPTADPSA